MVIGSEARSTRKWPSKRMLIGRGERTVMDDANASSEQGKEGGLSERRGGGGAGYLGRDANRRGLERGGGDLGYRPATELFGVKIRPTLFLRVCCDR